MPPGTQRDPACGQALGPGRLSLLPEESRSLAGSWGWQARGRSWCPHRAGPGGRRWSSQTGWRDTGKKVSCWVWQGHCSPTHMQVTTHRRNSDLSETQLGGGDHRPGSQDMVPRRKEAAATRVSRPCASAVPLPGSKPAPCKLPFTLQNPAPCCPL